MAGPLSLESDCDLGNLFSQDGFGVIHDSCQLTKKADVAEHPKVFHHVGLLFNGRPGEAE